MVNFDLRVQSLGSQCILQELSVKSRKFRLNRRVLIKYVKSVWKIFFLMMFVFNKAQLSHQLWDGLHAAFKLSNMRRGAVE